MSIFPVTPSRKAIHGKGRAELHVFGDNAHFAELSYTYPLKLLSPRATTAGENEAAERVAILYSMTYGGGLIGGDRVELSLELKERAKLVLLTQVCMSFRFDDIEKLTPCLVGVYQGLPIETQSKIVLGQCKSRLVGLGGATHTAKDVGTSRTLSLPRPAARSRHPFPRGVIFANANFPACRTKHDCRYVASQ